MLHLCTLFRVRTVVIFVSVLILVCLCLPAKGTRWAVLIAGSRGFANYRHQILRKSGLADENIIVFMFDDIAFNPQNPLPGTIINYQDGTDVYKGVPKDYVGEEVNRDNVLAVLIGAKSALRGGSGKVVGSPSRVMGQSDRIFIFFSGHVSSQVSRRGNQQLLSMPTGPSMTSYGLADILKWKHTFENYKSLVFYVEGCGCGSILDEACCGGSIFEGALPRDGGSIFEGAPPRGLNSTTASNGEDSNCFGYFHGYFHGAPPPEYSLSLGDMYSVAGMEDCDVHNLRTETLNQQYELVELVKARVIPNLGRDSYVMQYSDLGLGKKVFLYLGTNHSSILENVMPRLGDFSQLDTTLLHFWVVYLKSPDGSARKAKAAKELMQVMSISMHIVDNFQRIGNFLFGFDKGKKVLSGRIPGPMSDMVCFDTLVKTFGEHCYFPFQHSSSHMEVFDELCKAGVQQKQMAEASALVCNPVDWLTRVNGARLTPNSDQRFHVDKMSSAHVYVRMHKGQTIDDMNESLLEDCAQLVKANSIQGNKVNNIDVVYTPWSNLKKTASMDVGQVGFHDPKMVRTVRVEKRINEIVNRLNKTKVERKPDLKAEREAVNAAERAERKQILREKGSSLPSG